MHEAKYRKGVELYMTYDVFISHAWRYHDSWSQMVDLLDEQNDFPWRNFSMPWHDPAMSPHTENGSVHIHNCLENQIKPVDVVIILADVYAVKSNRKWLEFELNLARKYNKPVVGILPFDGREFHDFDDLLDKVVSWDIEIIQYELKAILQEISG
jgi:hypothetical protein